MRCAFSVQRLDAPAPHFCACCACCAGFYKAFQLNGFDKRLMSRLEEIVGGLQVDPSQLTFFVTGEFRICSLCLAAQRGCFSALAKLELCQD